VWRDTLGSTTDLRADADGNGMVDANDYTVWQSMFGTNYASGAGAAATVPEPTSFALLLVGAIGLAALCRRRNQ
jgi:hypothetical protein